MGVLHGPSSPPEVLGIEPLRPTSRHHDDLAGAIDRVLRRCGHRASELRRVAISRGPGGYTSLRIAVATAKMICFAAGAECVSVDTAVALARRIAERQDTPVQGNDEPCVAVALAGKEDSAWISILRGRATARAGLVDAAGLRAFLRPDLDCPAAFIADRFLPLAMREEVSRLGIRLAEPRFDPVAVLEAAAASDPIPTDELEPLYPRPPEAVTLWKARHPRR